jgi:hypothetical protein
VLLSREQTGFVEWTAAEEVRVDREHMETTSKLVADIFLQSASYIAKRIGNLHLPCFSSVTEEKNMP